MPHPPSGVRIPRQQRMVLDLIQRLTRISSQRGLSWLSGGPQIIPNGTVLRLGYTPGGGIPAADVPIDSDNPPPAMSGKIGYAEGIKQVTLALPRADSNDQIDFTQSQLQVWDDNPFNAYNPSAAALPANSVGIFALVDGQWMPVSIAGGLATAYTQGGITAATADALGQGRANIDQIQQDGTVRASGEVTVNNWFTAPIAAGTRIMLGALNVGWFVISADCFPGPPPTITPSPTPPG